MQTKMITVVAPDGSPVAAPCAISGCQYNEPRWLPMSCAPKDGTPVLVLAADDERFVGCWKRGAWELFGAYARIDPVFCWQPLPDPPVAAPPPQEEPVDTDPKNR